MKESAISKIVSIVQDIQHFDNSLLKLKNVEDPLKEVMASQFEHYKEKLFKELMVELVRSGISFSELKDVLMQMTTYLSRNGSKSEPISPLLKSSLKEAGRLAAAA